MRKIEFRAYSKRTKKMYNVLAIFFYQNVVKLSKTCGSGISFLEQLDDVVLMQYTGIKDKDGVQIFEGDIYRYEYYTGDGVEYRNSVVKWESTEIAYEGVFHGYELNNYEIEVIGNIYQNKDLLEG